MKRLVYKHPIEVRFCDLDGLGHINNAYYHSYIELARTRMLGKLGLFQGADVKGRFPIILARTEMDFVAQGSFNDAIEVTTWLSKLGTKSFTMDYEVRGNGQTLLAKARAVLVWFDFDKNISVPVPESARRIFQDYLHD